MKIECNLAKRKNFLDYSGISWIFVFELGRCPCYICIHEEYSCFWEADVLQGEEESFILIDKRVVPETYLKVLEAKRLLLKGKAKNSSEACKMAGLSRSAFYKYKDCVHNYEDKGSRRIITLYLSLSDEPGVLSSVLSCLSQAGANVVTVNQNIPAQGVAAVTVSVRIHQKNKADELTESLSQLEGVIEARRI